MEEDASKTVGSNVPGGWEQRRVFAAMRPDGPPPETKNLFMIAAQSRPPALAALGVFVKPQEREVNVRLAYPRKPRPREMVKPNIKQWFTVWYRYDDSYYPPRVIEFPNLEHEDLTDWLHITYHRVVAERPT
ncbi:MAG: hypothetical protein M1813_008039 [Trichoglossum hirsutum]|nr:MAG: hypothetical protein M1813_008039 [Trichoglossum hirsutum]